MIFGQELSEASAFWPRSLTHHGALVTNVVGKQMPLCKNRSQAKGIMMGGKYFEDLDVGAVLKHSLGRTITEMDNVLFTTLTMNPQPLHLDEHFAAKTQFGRRIVNGILTMGLAVGLTVSDLTEGTLVANLGYERVNHPHPMFHGDTLYMETEVLSKRESQSKPDRGIVRFRHIGRNQDGTIVIELERTVLMLKRPEMNGK